MHITDDNGWRALHFAARNGTYELIQTCTDMGSDIDVKTNDGKNSLHIAALYGHLNLCKELIDNHNFDVLMTDKDRWTAIHYSAISGSYELVKFLSGIGSDIRLTTNDGKNCLHIAARYGHLDLCKSFLEDYNLDVHITDNDGCTALHYSAENGSLDLFLFLLKKGSEIYSKTKSMRNALHLSASNGHFDICKYILGKFTKDYEENSTKNQYALNGRCYKNQIFYKCNTIFLHAKDVDGNSYLHLAAEANQAEICQLLLQYDTDTLHLSNKNNKTAMDLARDYRHEDVLTLLKPEYDRAGIFLYFSRKIYLLKDFTT